MRQLTMQVPKGQGSQVLALAAEHDGVHLSLTQAVGNNAKPMELIVALMPNRKVGDFLDAVEKNLSEADVALLPSSILSMQLPADEIPQALTDTQPRSSIEVFLGGVQSIGSWRSFLIYAVVAGIIVWIGLYTNSVFLLVASMLIAPFGGPAMNVAIASARGDFTLLKHSVSRYAVGILTMIATTFLLSFCFRQSIATAQMVSASEVSATAVLLPLAGGVAGAMQLVQSERSSLVSGTAIGMLVAAALAPPAGMVGMAIAIGTPEMAVSGLFLLMLQLVGINIACAIVFRLYGLKPRGPVYKRGKQKFFPIAMALSSLILALLLGWQFILSPSPELLRSSRAQRAATVIKEVVDNDPFVFLVESDVSFTRANIPEQDTLLGNVYIQPQPEFDISADATTRRLTREIQRALLEEDFNITPLVNVTLLKPLEE